MQLVELQRVLPELERAGYAVVAISYDSAAVLAEFADRQAITFPLLADEGSRTITALGVLDRDLDAHHREMGLDTRDDQWGVAYPVTFVLDGEGRVVRKLIEANYRIREGGSRLVERLIGAHVPPRGAHSSVNEEVVAATLTLDNETWFPYQRQTLEILLSPAPGWHVYGPIVPKGYRALSVSLNSEPAGVVAAAYDWPPRSRHEVEGLEESFEVYSGPTHVRIPLEFVIKRRTGDVRLTVRVAYQACSASVCRAPAWFESSIILPERPVP